MPNGSTTPSHCPYEGDEGHVRHRCPNCAHEDLSGPRQDFERSIYEMTDKEDRQLSRNGESLVMEPSDIKELAVFWARMPSGATDALSNAGACRLARAYLDALDVINAESLHSETVRIGPSDYTNGWNEALDRALLLVEARHAAFNHAGLKVVLADVMEEIRNLKERP